MRPELKAYLDEFEEKAQARHDASIRLFAQDDALLSKLHAGVSTPQPMCPMGTAADGSLTDEEDRVPVVVHDVFSATNQAKEARTAAYDASSVFIEMVPITCSMECQTQVVAIASVNEVHDATTTVRLEPMVDLFHLGVEQLMHVPSIGTNTSPAEAVTSVDEVHDTTIGVDSKTSVQELGEPPLPSINTSPQFVSEMDHIVALLVPNNMAAPTPSKCLAECPAYVGNWVKPLTATINSTNETDDTAIAERLHPPSFEHQPWPPPVQVQFNHMGSLFRPSPWPSFRPLSVTSYPDEPCSSIYSQSHGVHRSGLVLLLRDEDFIPISCSELIPLEEAFSLQVVELWLYIADGPTLLLWPPTNPDNFGNRVVKQKLGNGGYTVQTTVKAMKLQPAERFCFHLPPAKPPDYQPRMWSKLQEQILHTQLQNLIVALMELQPWPSWKFQFLILSVMTSTLKKCDCQHLLSAKACNLDKGCHKCHIFRREIDSKLLLSSSVQCKQPTSYSEFGSAQAYLKLHEVCAATLYLFEDYLSMWSGLPIGELPTDCYYSAVRNIVLPVPISVDDFGSVRLIEHWFLVVHAQVRQWAWGFCKEKLSSIKYLACKIQEQGKFYEHHILEYVVGGILLPDKLQETIHIMTVSIQLNFLSQDGFKWSRRSARGCISFALGMVALTSFPIDSSKSCSKQFGNEWQAYAPAYLKSDDACTTVVHKFKKRASNDWDLMLYFDQRPRSVYGMANSSTVDLYIPGIFLCIRAIHVSWALCSDQSMMLHLNQWSYPSDLEMANPGQIILCNSTMHISTSVQRSVFSISANIRADALITSAFNGTTCRITDTATHAGFSMAGAEYFSHWDFLYEFHQEALITLVRELWYTYQVRFFSVTLVHLVQWHNMLLACGLVLSTTHKRVLQIVEELRDLVPPMLLRNISSKSVAELTYGTSIWNREGCNCVIWMTPINEEESTSTVFPPVSSFFSGFASSGSLIHSVDAFNYSMPTATTLKWATKFGALILGKLSRIFCLQFVQVKHRLPFSVAAMSTQQLSFRMKTSTESVTILKIYSRMFQDWISHLVSSTSASDYQLRQLWDSGGLAGNLCSARALTFPRHFLFEFWSAGVLSIYMQMRVEKPMTSGELNLWMAIIVYHTFYLTHDQVPNGSDYYLGHDRFSKIIQVHLNYGYYHDNYHGEPGMIKDLQAPWDPGKFFTVAAWGQAAFQEGRDVRGLLGSPFRSTWARPSCALTRGCHYKYGERKRRGGSGLGSETATAASSSPTSSSTSCTSSFLLLQSCS